MTLSVGKAIKIMREAKGDALGELAVQAHISTPYLSLLETGKRTPSLAVIDRLANALDVPVDVFLLLASGQRTSLATTSIETNRLLAILKQMEEIEKRVKDVIGDQKY